MTGSRPRLERWLVRVLVFSFLQTLVLQAVRPMVSYRALDLGADGFWLGIIAGCFALFSFLAAVPLGRRIEPWGEPRILLGGTLITLTSTAMLLVIDSLVALAVSQAFFGLGQVMIVVATQALIGNAGDPRERDRRYGALTVVVSIGQFVGPAMAGVIAGGGFATGVVDSSAVDTRSVFLVSIIAAAVSLVAAVTFVVWPPEGAGPRRGASTTSNKQNSLGAMREVLAIRGMPRALFVGMSVLTTIDVLIAYLPAFAQETGMSVQTVGWLLATRAAASVLSRIGMIRLMNWLGRRTLLLIAVLLAGAALAAFPFVPLVIQYVMMVIIGFGLGLGQPVTLSWVAGRAPRSLRGPALGVRLSGNRLGQVLVPALVGVLVGASGVGVVFAALAVSLLASGVVLYGAQFALPEEPEE